MHPAEPGFLPAVQEEAIAAEFLASCATSKRMADISKKTNNLYSNNSATAAEGIMRTAGIADVLDTFRPEAFIDQLGGK
jgi:hypothetical protein